MKPFQCNYFLNKTTHDHSILLQLNFVNTMLRLWQERRLKRLITLGGLEIGIQHQIVKALELSNPPPPQKKKKNEKLLILVIGLVEKLVALWNSLVIWKLAHYTGTSPKSGSPTVQVFHLWLFCWYCSFAMCIPVRTNIHGSVAFPVLLPIDKRKIHIIIET